MEKKKLAILGSGRGSNMQAIADAAKTNNFPAEVAVVISDVENAYILKRAADENIDYYHINPKNFTSKDEYEKNIISYLKKYQIDLICLAGYMRIVGKTLIESYHGRILNIHPSLLPSFPGLNAQKQAFDYGVKVSGCTVHFVDAGVDTGAIIGQQIVFVKQGETPETLSERILEEEHKLYPECIKLVIEGKTHISGRRVQII